MSRNRGLVSLAEADNQPAPAAPATIADSDDSDYTPAKKKHRRVGVNHWWARFWPWGMILLALTAVVVAVAAYVTSLTSAQWSYDSAAGRITNHHAGADVVVREGGDLVVHGGIVDSFQHTVYEMLTLSPIFGPAEGGAEAAFGAASAPYARLQAASAVGVRVRDRGFWSLGGAFAANGLFGEDGLAAMFDTFSTWVHGPIIGTGPAFLVLSDEAAKENIESLDPRVALDRVSRLEPRSFDWTGARAEAAAHLSAKRRQAMLGVHGFVAQEVATAIPAAVHSTGDYLPEGAEIAHQALMDYNAIVVELVGAVQSLWTNGVLAAVEAVRAPAGPIAAAEQACATSPRPPRDAARCICAAARLTCQQVPAQTQCAAVARACGSA